MSSPAFVPAFHGGAYSFKRTRIRSSSTCNPSNAREPFISSTSSRVHKLWIQDWDDWAGVRSNRLPVRPNHSRLFHTPSPSKKASSQCMLLPFLFKLRDRYKQYVNTKEREKHAIVKPSFNANREMAVLELQGIQYRQPSIYDDYLFLDLNFAIYPNELVVILGGNGTGKSTLLMLCNGTIPPDEGVILYRGEIATKNSDLLHSKCGMVIQFPAEAFLCQTVLEELTLFRPTTPEQVRVILTAVGLEDISLRADPRRLSGGQQRRLALASQLLRTTKPEILLLDEPLAGIDIVTRQGMIQLLDELKSIRSIVVVTHEPGELLEYADRVVQLVGRKTYLIDKEFVKKAAEIRRDRGEYDASEEIL